MNFLIYLVVGGIAGWLASLVMRRNSSLGVVLNVLVGIAGGFVGSWLLPQVGLGFEGQWWGFLVTAFIGAVVLLLILNLFTRGRVR